MNLHYDEIYYLDLISKKLNGKNNLTIFDVGCNKGCYTEELISKLGINNNYYLFDPSIRFLNVCHSKFQRFNNIKLNNMALGDIEQINVKFNELESNDLDAEGMSSFINRSVFKNYKVNTINVSCTTLDSFVANNNIQKINFIKIDTEGFDLNVLKGSKNCFNKEIIDALQIEYGGCAFDNNYDLKDILDFISSFPYKLFIYINNEFVEITHKNYINFNKIMYCNLFISKINFL